MAWEQVPESFEWAQAVATADLTGKVFYIAQLNGSGNIALASAATQAILGVIREENIIGKPCTVQFGGVGKVIAGGTINAGDRVTSDGSGKAIATTTTGNRTLGMAMMDADANEIFSVLICPATL